MSNLFGSKWKRVKEALVEGLSENRANSMEVVLENTLREYSHQSQNLFENASAGATASGNVAALNRVILPMIRRVLPGVIAHEIVGVQPLPGPWGQVHSLKVKYANTAGGAIAGQEMFAPAHVAQVAAAYSGNENANSAAAADTTTLEGVAGNPVQISIDKKLIEAKTRKLSATWTPEAAQDAQAMHGIDLESEILTSLAQEMVIEIDQEILGKLRTLPPAPTTRNTFDQSSVSGQATSVVDEFAALAVMINDEANQIATRTRRGVGNWIVVSPKALTILQSARASQFARTTEGELEGPTNTKFVGTLNGQVKVFVDTFAGSNSSVLVGYKGNTEIDAGTFYCPYVPLTSSPVIYHPETFQPTVSFMTRYAWVEFTNRADSLGNSADYLGLVGINANTLTFY